MKYAFTTVIVTLAIAVVVSLVSIVKMNVDTYKFYKEAYANSTLQMEIRKDIQLVGKYILWSMTTDHRVILIWHRSMQIRLEKMLPHWRSLIMIKKESCGIKRCDRRTEKTAGSGRGTGEAE